MDTVTLTVPAAVRSWKTTLIGAVMAVGTYLCTLDGTYKVVGQALVVICPFVFGLLAKDADVSGATVTPAV